MIVETVIEGICVAAFLLYPLYLIRPFTWESAMTAAQREWKAGNIAATVTRKWYGWIVKH
tara:strand:+ start:947 stop:1126 length:180 start_codon:yes stop_codon:yes gene_type:complete